jgi:hypothetical protein
VEVRDERVGDFEVVQTLSELNLAFAHGCGLPFPPPLILAAT